MLESTLFAHLRSDRWEASVKTNLYKLLFTLVFTTSFCAQNPPAAPSDVLLQADEAFRAGKFDTAVEKYQSVLQQSPASVDGYAGLARTYLKMEKVTLALETASKGVEVASDSPRVHAALGEVYFRQAKMTEAEKEFLAGVNNPHPDARAYLGLSRLYDAYSLHARARSTLERAHQLDPGDREIQRRWIRTLTLRDQIQWLSKYLAGPNNDDEFTNQSLQTYLEVLTERSNRPRHTCRLVSKVTSTEAALKPMMLDATHFHGFGLEVKVNGHASRLLVDTGASGLLINKKLPEKAGIQPIAESKIRGIGNKGDAAAYVGYADSIRVGELEFQNCLVEVSNKRSVLEDDGLIGADVFSHYLVTLDFLWHKLKLEELPQRPGDTRVAVTLASQEENEVEDESPSDGNQQKEKSGQAGPVPDPGAVAAKPENPRPQNVAAAGPRDAYVAPEMKAYTKVFRFGHQLLIPTRVGDAPPKLFLIDTGATLNTISPEAAREVTKVRGNDRMIVKGISGTVKNVYSADKAMLQFSRYRQENQDLTAFDLSGVSKSTGTEVSGILGFITLKLFTLKIDYRDGSVDFVYTGPKQ
jgi:predicted aspartyl protease/Tfp pilus assembly protein PilF